MTIKWQKRQSVDVWQASLNLPESEFVRLRALLSAEERARADRFKFTADQRRFAVGRGVLREILSHYLPFAPQDLSLVYNSYGKPQLNSAIIEQYPLQFNVSHSQNLLVVVISEAQTVGVDVEYCAPLSNLAAMAQMVMSSRELACFEQLDAAHQLTYFYHLWTAKEAYVKGLGYGIRHSLTHIEVTLQGQVEAMAGLVTQTEANLPIFDIQTTNPALESGWQVQVLAGPEAYVGYVATRRTQPAPKLHYQRWTQAQFYSEEEKIVKPHQL